MIASLPPAIAALLPQADRAYRRGMADASTTVKVPRQAATGGERPVVRTGRSVPRTVHGAATAHPASASVHAPRIAGLTGSEPTTLEVQAVQCCGVLSSHRRSWCSNGAVTRKRAYIANAATVSRRQRMPDALEPTDPTDLMIR